MSTQTVNRDQRCIAPPTIETIKQGAIAILREEVRRERALKTELLEALRKIAGFTDAQMKGTYYACAGEMQSIARAAIAAATVQS